MNKKAKNAVVEIRIVEVTKSNSTETQRVIDGASGRNLNIEFVGGNWKDKRAKIPCPACHKIHTTIEFGLYDIGWDEAPILTKTEGRIDSLLGNFRISCNDCRKVFIYLPSGHIDLSCVGETTINEN